MGRSTTSLASDGCFTPTASRRKMRTERNNEDEIHFTYGGHGGGRRGVPRSVETGYRGAYGGSPSHPQGSFRVRRICGYAGLGRTEGGQGRARGKERRPSHRRYFSGIEGISLGLLDRRCSER